MKPNALVLLVGESPPELDEAFENLRGRSALRVVRVGRPATACARIGGGGVDVVLLRAASSGTFAIESTALISRVAREVPVLALCAAGDELAGEAAVRAGATAYLPVSRCITDLGGFLEAAMDRHYVSRQAGGVSGRAGSGAILAIAGSKGGVGTTTLAQNAAAILARHHRVVLTELRPQFGGLHYHFLTRPAKRNWADLLASDPATIDVADVEACLWQYSGLPGLRVLFAPQGHEPASVSAAYVRAVLDSLGHLADYVVVDLSSSCSEANRAAIQRSDLLAVVLERDPVCLPIAKALLGAIEIWNITPQLTGAVIVNRVALATSFDQAEAEAELGIPVFGVIPPSPELCIAARQALMPMAVFDAEGLVTDSIEKFVSHLRIRARAPANEDVRGSGVRV